MREWIRLAIAFSAVLISACTSVPTPPIAGLSKPVQLIIVGSTAGPKYRGNEAIVLEQRGWRVTWKAEAAAEDNSRRGFGEATLANATLSDVFEKVQLLQREEADAVEPSRQFWGFYSLVLVDAKGARYCDDLDAKQRILLGELLRPVFDDVVKHMPLNKGVMISEILYDKDTRRQRQKIIMPEGGWPAESNNPFTSPPAENSEPLR